MRGNLMNFEPNVILPLKHRQDTVYKFENKKLKVIKYS